MSDVITLVPAITLLGVGLACILAARLIRTSPIVTFIAAGVLIGPNAFDLAPLNATTALLAQRGAPEGLAFAAALLRESGIAEADIARWMRERMEADAPETIPARTAA